MRFTASVILGVAALACGIDAAAASDGCGRGMYWSGYGCAPKPYAPPVPQYYQPQPQPYYQQPYGGGGYYQQQQRREAYPIGRGGQCPRGYTIQHGRCEPYRGR